MNQGYVVGFSPTTLQPAWSAYSVAHADAAVDFRRPFHYYTDVRLDAAKRLSNRTFGKISDIPLNVGHMTPNEVINRQYGRLAQAETFLRSNMSPQYEALNQGVWAKLEESIRAVQTAPDGDYAWVIVGPVFGDDPEHVSRDGGPGTALSHWDEALFDRELMTGYKDKGEYVLLVTIDVMEAFGHEVIERLPAQTSLEELLQGIASLVFSRQDEVRQIDLDYFEKTPVRETLPHGAAFE